MQKSIIITSDGSHSIEIPGMQVTYHSLHGAIQESRHVFIEAGLNYFLTQNPGKPQYAVFEMGLGTGLNALLTLETANRVQQKMVYEAIEAFPLEEIIVQQLNYCNVLNQPALATAFNQLHTCPWNEIVSISPWFSFKKINADLTRLTTTQQFHLIYYDAFAPDAQPELWTETIFQQLSGLLLPGGIIVTYSSKGSVRRAMQAAGFRVEKLPGPKGKREMIRAIKPV